MSHKAPGTAAVGGRPAFAAGRHRSVGYVRRRRAGPAVAAAAVLGFVAALSWGAARDHFDGRSIRLRYADATSGSLVLSPYQSAFKDSSGRARAVLDVSGRFALGSSDRVAAALDAAGLVAGDAVALDSPGGSLPDGIAVGQLVRRRGLSAFVGSFGDEGFAPGQCASSCVMALAGGVHRIVVDGSDIGVHQFTAERSDGTQADPGSVQRMAAGILDHLSVMGVSPSLLEASSWSSAVKWLTPEEAVSFGLQTMSWPRSR